jgi:hypothetical protein
VVRSLLRVRHSLAAVVGLLALGFLPSTAAAGLTQWTAQVNAGTPPVVVQTNIFTPSLINIGPLSGNITYEFIVNGADRASAGSLIGSLTGGQHEAIRFEQYPNTNMYGVTAYGVADYVFNVPTTFNTDVDLAFVVNSAAGTTRLFVNGVDTGATVPYAVTLHGTVGFGSTATGTGFLDPSQESFQGNFIGFASFNSALSGAELKAHSDAYFGINPATPEPVNWAVFLGVGVVGLAGNRLRRRVG